jgi:hypothetical protein
LDSYSVDRRGKKREPDLFDPNLKFSIIYFQQRQQESSILKKEFGRLNAIDGWMKAFNNVSLECTGF